MAQKKKSLQKKSVELYFQLFCDANFLIIDLIIKKSYLLQEEKKSHKRCQNMNVTVKKKLLKLFCDLSYVTRDK